MATVGPRGDGRDRGRARDNSEHNCCAPGAGTGGLGGTRRTTAVLVYTANKSYIVSYIVSASYRHLYDLSHAVIA